MLKSAIIGAGIMGELHTKACAQYKDVKLTAICDINEGKARKLAQDYGGEIAVYTDYRDMLDESDVDIIHILTPDFAHAEPLLDSIKAGKHIIVEKPLITSRKDLEEVKKAIEKTKTKVFVNFSNRWNPVYQNVKKAIVNFELGEIRHGYARISNTLDIPLKMLRSWAHKSSPTGFLLPHFLDLVRWFLEDEAAEVFAYTTEGVLKSQGVDTHDSINDMIRFQKGEEISLESSWILPVSHPTSVDYCIELIGSKGAVYTDGNDECIKKYCRKPEHPRSFLIDALDGRGIGFFYESLYNFFDAIIGRRESISNYQDGLKNAEVILAILLSAREHRVVKLPLV
ncbi:Inositol 2-dehydrogenase/D-chiro-inositol 3-dehydrogenase [subsurface metagenome]